jgi:alpha-galactosidase
MTITAAITQLHVPFAGALTDASQGFRFATSSGHLAFTDTTGDGVCWKDRTGCFDLQRQIEKTPTGLVIRSTVTNLSDTTPSLLNAMEPLSLEFAVGRQDWVHYFAKGGVTDWWLPPKAYSTQVAYDLQHSLYLQSHGAGRSSNEDLPLLISVAEPLKAGLFFGMEWSGEWVIQMRGAGDDRVRAAVSFKSPLLLEPGESFDLPPVHLGFFDGGFDEGTNALRRHLYEQVCPPYKGKPTLPRVSYDHWFGIENRNTIDFMKTQVDRAAEMGVEVFVHDAAWFTGGFPNGVGNWDQVDAGKFPNGLEELADYVRGKGMDFGLWFEIERAAPETSAVRLHPEFFVEAPQPYSSPFGGCTGLQFHLNLALPAAQDWAIESVGGWIECLDLRWSRWDYNIEPNPFWRSVDPSGQIQFAYMRGLYRVLDTLMQRYPNWMVETCASGGRRLDLGMIRRAHTAWFSDHTEYPAVCRHMQARANRFLPGNLLNSSVAVGYQHGDGGFDDTAILSRMLGKLAFDGDIASWSPSLTLRARHWTDAFKAIRHLLVQDFHQLTPAPATADEWDVMSFNAYVGSEAALFAFSGRKAGEKTVRLRGLAARKTYRVTCLNNGKSTEATGETLMRAGLALQLSANEGRLWHVCERQGRRAWPYVKPLPSAPER